MAGWTTTHGSRVRFVADEKSVTRYGTGVQISWDDVDDAFINATTGKKELPAGTRLGATLSGNGQFSERVDTTNPAEGILETSAVEGDTSAPGGGMYGMIVGGNLYENLLPGASGTPAVIDADEKTELAAAGCHFHFQNYADTP